MKGGHKSIILWSMKLKEVLRLRIDKALLDRVRAEAKKEKVGMSEFVRKILNKQTGGQRKSA